MPQTDPFPAVPEPLLKELERLFPDRCPSPDWSSRKIWMEVGKRSVVKFLRERFDHQIAKAQKGKTHVHV